MLISSKGKLVRINTGDVVELDENDVKNQNLENFEQQKELKVDKSINKKSTKEE